jgi:hypothetical protein
VINTGDLVLEGNNGGPEIVESRYRYYREVVSVDGLTIYETIGNNELAGTDNDAFGPGDPRYGKLLFRRYFGPSHYSFDQGGFHFAALDTHRALFDLDDDGADEEWSFHDMEPEVRDWLDADLARANAAGQRIVVLNHEPFHDDPAWEFDDPTPADDQGLFEKHAVAYVLAGHIHRNGFQDAPPNGGVTHITTGALSGFRWSLPLTIDSRGYRLVYAHDGKLYSAWKELAEPLLGFVDPRGEAAIHPGSTHPSAPDSLEGRVDVVAVGVDARQPFADLTLWLDGEPLETVRWGDYFVHTSFDAARLGEVEGVLELRASGLDGSSRSARLAIRSTSRER